MVRAVQWKQHTKLLAKSERGMGAALGSGRARRGWDHAPGLCKASGSEECAVPGHKALSAFDTKASTVARTRGLPPRMKGIPQLSP